LTVQQGGETSRRLPQRRHLVSQAAVYFQFTVTFVLDEEKQLASQYLV
jgi:hypothetical protein